MQLTYGNSFISMIRTQQGHCFYVLHANTTQNRLSLFITLQNSTAVDISHRIYNIYMQLSVTTYHAQLLIIQKNFEVTAVQCHQQKQSTKSVIVCFQNCYTDIIRV